MRTAQQEMVQQNLICSQYFLIPTKLVEPKVYPTPYILHTCSCSEYFDIKVQRYETQNHMLYFR